MEVYLRKISRKKWPEDGVDFTNNNLIPADPITRDMNAAENTFSLWCFSDSDINTAAITIALSGPRIDDIDITYLLKEEIESDGLVLKTTNGRTDYQKYKVNHYDIVNMNYESLGKVAMMIINSINNKRVLKFRKKKMMKMIKELIDSGEINKGDLKPEILDQLEKAM